MQPDLFKKKLQENIGLLETKIKTLMMESYEIQVVDSIKELAIKQKTAVQDLYNKMSSDMQQMSSDIQQKVSANYSDFIKRSDELVKKAVDAAAENYREISYANDVFYNDKHWGWGVIKNSKN